MSTAGNVGTGGTNGISCDRSQVEGVMQDIGKQINVIQSDAFNPLRAILGQIANGVWIGKGADAFVEEVSNIVLADIGRATESLTGFNTNVKSALDKFEQADNNASGAIGGFVGDVIGRIF
jgi:uncharacterized protein YukE